MREIRFRAWDKINKLMSPVGRVDFGKSALIYQPLGMTEDGDVEWDGADIALDNLELMQFTGLLDKNGKEIYEGDIVRSEYGVGYDTKMYPSFTNGTHRVNIFEVKFEDCSYNLSKPHDGNFDKEFEIIGNIYENPELIK